MAKRIVIMSIKPKYIKKILDHTKTVELRRKCPQLSNGDLIIFYVSSPVMSISASASVTSIIKDVPSNIWKMYQQYAGIEKKDFDEYFEGCDRAFGIVLGKTKEYYPLTLDKLKLTYCFKPPQSFRYLTQKDMKIVQTLKEVK